MPPLEGLLFRSQLVSRLGPLHMCLLVDRARRANRIAGITGQLIYFERVFYQYFEGPPAAVETLWRRLQRDQRHHELELLARHAIERRRFPGAPLAFAGHAYFRQYQMSGHTTANVEAVDALLDFCAPDDRPRWREEVS